MLMFKRVGHNMLPYLTRFHFSFLCVLSKIKALKLPAVFGGVSQDFQQHLQHLDDGRQSLRKIGKFNAYIFLLHFDQPYFLLSLLLFLILKKRKAGQTLYLGGFGASFALREPHGPR